MPLLPRHNKPLPAELNSFNEDKEKWRKLLCNSNVVLIYSDELSHATANVFQEGWKLNDDDTETEVKRNVVCNASKEIN